MKKNAKVVSMAMMAFFSVAGASAHAEDEPNCLDPGHYTGRITRLEPVPNYDKDSYKINLKTDENKNYSLPTDEDMSPRTDSGKALYATLMAASISGNRIEVWCKEKNKVANVVLLSY